MEKNKGLFSFRKHSVVDFLDGEKGRKRKGSRLRQSMGFLLAAALVFNTLPASGLAVSASGREVGLCEHHTKHTPDCGYMEAQPCIHEHGEECYTTVTECVHTHTDGCYPEAEETEASAGEGNATASDAEDREPENCTHQCSEESGCITKSSDCHHEHDESCGYKEAQECSYVCEICNGTESEDTGENTENTEDVGTDTAECICKVLCTEDSINGDCPVCGAEDADLSGCVGKETVNSSEEDVEYDNAVTDMAECICKTLCTEDSINGDCPICSVEDADLFHCKGEKTEEQEKTGEKVITAWEWIDPEEYLTDGMLVLPGAGRENPAFMEAVTALLPEKIQAEVVIVNAAKNGEETEEDAEAAPETEDAEITLTGWGCASYPEDGAYEGAYIFTAFLPEGFVLTEDAAALEVKVELGGAEMLLRGEVSAAYQEASWNGSEVTYTGKTENCTVVESNTEAVTWNAGWYVVNSTVTISEPVTVNGAVNLILADGCTLTAEKGIVVTDGNSLTIYAQSGGTGTLTATGTTDSGNNASAGIGGSIASVDSGAITIHGGMINTTGGGQSGYYGGAGIGGGTLKSGNGGNSGAVIIYGGTVTANSGEGDLAGAGIGGGSGSGGGTSSNITIYGGSVIANSTGTGTGGAGIGGGGGLTSGGAGNNIQICGGTINATGNSKGAGIGGGGGGSGDKCTSGDGTVTISGGIVTAVGGSNAAGIGGGGGYKFEYAGTVMTNITGGAGTVTISGGIVDAKNGGSGDPIGNGGNTTAQATVSKENAIVFENGVGTVVGNVTFDGSYEVPTGCSLNIPDGATLSGTGTLSGGGTFTIENLTEDMISVPDIHYTSEDMTEKIKEKVTISGKTVCGQTFMVDMDSWILNVAKVSDMEYTATYTHTEKGTVSKTVTILPCIHNNGEALTHHEGREADCTQTGVKEYWDCSICGKNFSDKDGKTEITDTELPIAAHTLIHHDRVEADCTQTGVKEYWGCSVCGKKFSDQNGQTEITDINIPVTAHTLTHHEGQEANCTAAGNKEYWDCSVCGKKFSDQNGQTEIADADIIIPVKTHTLTHHARQEADCLTDGTIEYWSCDVCNKLFADSDGKKEVTDIKVSAKGHDYGAWGSNGNGTHTHSCKTPGCGFTETEDCFGGTATYTEKAVCTVCGDKYGELLQDVGAPTGEISIGTNKWNSFLNKITFGLFFKKTEQVTITAQDNESGVASVSYYISDSELTEEEVKKLDNWTAGNTDKTTFRISQDKSCVVYAKITDKQGNVTYISSDGLVFDGTSPSITGIADGEIYCTSQEVVVTDNNSESVTVTVNGKEQTLSDSKFTLDVKFDTTPMIITATDKAGNVTTVTVYVGHNYGTDWKSDSNGHWQECAVCGNKSEVLTHTEDSGTVTKPATQTETGIRTYKCSVCGYEIRTAIIEKLPESHTHSYGTEWKSDSNNHWHECDCGDKSDSAAHTEDSGSVTKPATETETGIRTYKCSVCGYKIRTEIIEKLPESHKHSYGTEWKSDNSNHWHECDCGEKNGTAAHTWDSGTVTVQPTTDKEGEKTFTCTVCSRTKTETVGKLPQSHTHSYGAEWKSDNNNHWHECDCGEKNSIAAHTWDSGIITVQPTTDREGEKRFTCTVCGRTKTETVGKLPPSHTHSYGTEWKSDNNNHWHECSCGEKKGIAAHTWDSGTITVQPTTDREGEKRFTCTVCGRIKTETVGKLPPSHTHSYGTDWKSDSNSHWHECDCGAKNSIAAHTWDSGTITVQPTTDREGEKRFTCTVCGRIKTETVGKLPPSHTHSYGTDWKSDSNSHWHECDCGAKNSIAAHTWDSGTITVQPTTDREGEKRFTCTVCGGTKTETVGKLPQSHTHSYGTNWKSDSNSHWHECTCGEKNSIAAHTWDSGTVTVQPTTDREGEKIFTCTVCGRTKTETVGKLPQSHTESSQPGDKKPDNNSNQPNNGNTEDTKVDTGIPFIKDEDGKNGWNVIRTEEEKAEEGSIINVDMNGSTVVPGDIFDSIKGKDITITFDMGNGIIWSVNGKSITTEKADDIDFSIKTGTNAIPVDIVNNITGERYSIQLSLSHEGEFGFTAILSINLGKDNAGLIANLYYYNESTGELEFICADTVAEDGMVSLAFTHASDYAVVIDADSMEQETGAGSTAEAPKTGEESTSADTTDTSVKNDLWNRIWVFVLCGVLVVAGLGIFFVGRKKNSKG